MNIGIRNPKVEKENHDCSKYYQNQSFTRTIQLGKIIMEGSQQFLIFESMLDSENGIYTYFTERRIRMNPYSLEKGSKKLLLAASGNR